MQIAVLLMDGMRGFDLSVVLEVFGTDRTDAGVPRSDVRICSPQAVPVLEHGLRVQTRPLTEALGADLVIVPGFSEPPPATDCDTPPWRALLDTLVRTHAAGAELASLCTGAFALARSGLLDGGIATTHWRYCELLRGRHPAVTVDSQVLYTHDALRRIWTSAGVTAGIDLCLAITARRFGAAATAAVARSLVLPAVRAGGQSQFVPPRSGDAGMPGEDIERLCALMRASPSTHWTVGELAGIAGLSTRTLQRRFKETTGMGPAQWLLRERIIGAQELLETTDLAIEAVAHRVGLSSGDLLRKHFARQLGTSPSRYREAFTVT